MNELYELFSSKIRNVTYKYKRYLYDTINWDSKLVIIKGTPKVGKTTLVLQYVKLNLKIDNSVLYIDLNDFYFIGFELKNFIEKFVTQGGERLFIDNIHSCTGWQSILQEVLTNNENLKITAVVSSAEEILSNFTAVAANLYELTGLSLREFIMFSKDIILPVLTIDDIVSSHVAISGEITRKIDPLMYLSAYMRYGYYPFFAENRTNYRQLMTDAITQFLKIDFAQLRKIDGKNILALNDLLSYIATNNPSDKPNVKEISDSLGPTRGTLLTYIDYLHQSGFLNLLKEQQKSSSLKKPDKIFFDNVNIYSLFKKITKEDCFMEKTFLYSQVKLSCLISYHENYDFVLKNKYKLNLINKTNYKNNFETLHTETLFVVADIEVGFKNKIPLWMFGLMY